MLLNAKQLTLIFSMQPTNSGGEIIAVHLPPFQSSPSTSMTGLSPLVRKAVAARLDTEHLLSRPLQSYLYHNPFQITLEIDKECSPSPNPSSLSAGSRLLHLPLATLVLAEPPPAHPQAPSMSHRELRSSVIHNADSVRRRLSGVNLMNLMLNWRTNRRGPSNEVEHLLLTRRRKQVSIEDGATTLHLLSNF